MVLLKSILGTFERALHLWKALVSAGLQSKSPRSMIPPMPWCHHYAIIPCLQAFKTSSQSLFQAKRGSLKRLMQDWLNRTDLLTGVGSRKCYPVWRAWSYSGNFWERDIAIAIDIYPVPQGPSLVILQWKSQWRKINLNLNLNSSDIGQLLWYP